MPQVRALGRRVRMVAVVALAVAAARAGERAGGRPGGRRAVDRRARRLGDLRRGRPLGGQHERLAVEASTRSARRAYCDNAPARRGDPRLPSLQGGRGRTSAAA